MDGLHEPMSSKSRGVLIHATAVISPGAELGVGVRVGPFCTVGPDAIIEDGATLISHVVVDGDTTIGAGATLYPFSTVGMAPQDLKYRGEPTRCVIGPRTQIREHCTIHRGTPHGLGVTTVGADCMLMAVVHVAHDCTLGNEVIIANNAVMGGHVTIGDYAVIGGQSALHQFIRIGRGAMVSGVAGVAGDVIPFGFVVGNRGELQSLNLIGLKRRGFGHARIHAFRAAFRTLFMGEGTFAGRLASLAPAAADEPLIDEMLRFIAAPSRRGLLNAHGVREELAAAA